MALSAAGLASGLAGAGSVAFSSIVADGSTPGLSTDGTSVLGLAVSAGAGVSVLGLAASADAGVSVLGLAASAGAGVSVLGLAASAGAGASVLGLAVSAGAGVSVLGLAASADAGASVLGLAVSADVGASVLGLAVSADAGASVLGAERSVSAELAEKTVPASADGTSLSSLEPVRLLVVPEVPPPPMLALSELVTTSLAAVGELSDDTGLLSSTRPATSSAATTWSPRF